LIIIWGSRTRGRQGFSHPRLHTAPGVGVEVFGELVRTAQHDVVAARHLVGLDAEALASVALST
jgi:hypothetical protein